MKSPAKFARKESNGSWMNFVSPFTRMKTFHWKLTKNWHILFAFDQDLTRQKRSGEVEETFVVEQYEEFLQFSLHFEVTFSWKKVQLLVNRSLFVALTEKSIESHLQAFALGKAFHCQFVIFLESRVLMLSNLLILLLITKFTFN